MPDEDCQRQMLQQIARLSLEQGIPLSHAQGMTREHPLFHNDRELVENVFATTCEPGLMEEYRKRNKLTLSRHCGHWRCGGHVRN